jgi:hypothetical protein
MTDNPKTWGEMTPEEKGALLLAHHYRKEIQFYNGFEWVKAAPTLDWLSDRPYRVKPEPKRETARLSGRFDILGDWIFWAGQQPLDTHRITFDTIDGEPDCASIRMEKLK